MHNPSATDHYLKIRADLSIELSVCFIHVPGITYELTACVLSVTESSISSVPGYDLQRQLRLLSRST